MAEHYLDVYVKVEDSLQQIKNMYIKISNQILKVREVWEKVNGQWVNVVTLDTIVPQGIIAAWSGSIDDIPDGWVLCNGQNGTPDLKDRFIKGTNLHEKIGKKTSPTPHSHSVEVGGIHSHTIGTGEHYHQRGSLTSSSGTPATRPTSSGYNAGYAYHDHDGTTNNGHTHNTSADIALPEFYALAFIMKV